jgi:hypothetical protein
MERVGANVQCGLITARSQSHLNTVPGMLTKIRSSVVLLTHLSLMVVLVQWSMLLSTIKSMVSRFTILTVLPFATGLNLHGTDFTVIGNSNLL